MKVKEIMRKATAFLLLTSMNLGSIGANTIYAADMTGDGTNVATQVVPEPLKQGTLAVKVNSIGGTVEINTDGTNDTQIIRKEADKTTLTDAAGNVTEAVVTDEGYALVLEADEGTVVHTSKKNYVATISSCRSHGKRRINMSTYGNDWIITFSNSEDTDVFFWRFFGTEEDVKEKLVTLAKEHSTDTESDLLQCPDSAGDVEENTETCALFCTVGYEDYDYVFTAMDFRAMNHI